MKNMVNKEQKINLIDCEEIQPSDTFQNNTSQIRQSIPVNIKFSDDEKPQVVNIHQTGPVVRIKQAK